MNSVLFCVVLLLIETKTTFTIFLNKTFLSFNLKEIIFNKYICKMYKLCNEIKIYIGTKTTFDFFKQKVLIF